MSVGDILGILVVLFLCLPDKYDPAIWLKGRFDGQG